MTYMATIALAWLLAWQAKPKVDSVAVLQAGGQLVITLPYTLQGNPDSVLTTITGIQHIGNRRPASGFYATRDTMMVAQPVAGTVWQGQYCAQAKKGTQTSQPACSPWNWTQPQPTLLPPIVQPVTVDTVPAILFYDNFASGARAGPQNGISYSSTNGVEPIIVVPDSTNASGFSLRFRFRGAPSGSDAFSEQNMKLGEYDEIFFCTVYRVPANYVHRDDKPGNNKGIRVFGAMYANAPRDSAYQHSSVHIGYSTLAYTGGRSSDQMIVEFSAPGGTGNYNTGPWWRWFEADSVVRIGFYTKAGTTTGTVNPISGHGIIRVWKNRVLVYDRTDLPIGKTGANNKYQWAYLLGWANSGFTEQTDILLQELAIARTPIPGCVT